jgi:DNA-binding HxlR family transcriptional regulator
MYERKMPLKKRNGIDITFYVIGGKWKRDIISCLHKGIKRPSELQKHLAEASASARVLRQQLKELERFGVIYKKVYPVVPLKVEYFLTDIGTELIPLFKSLDDWGSRYESINKQVLGEEKVTVVA